MNFKNPTHEYVPNISHVAATVAAVAAFGSVGATVSKGQARVAEFELNCGAVASSHTLDVKPQYQDSAGNWNNFLDINGGTIAFAQRTNANSASGSYLRGVIPIAELDVVNLRCVATVVGGSGVAFGTSINLFDNPSRPPSGEVANAWAALIGPAARMAGLPTSRGF